jgi:hypothetical protein
MGSVFTGMGKPGGSPMRPGGSPMRPGGSPMRPGGSPMRPGGSSPRPRPRPVRADDPRCLRRGGCGPDAGSAPPLGAGHPQSDPAPLAHGAPAGGACGDAFALWRLLIEHYLRQRPVVRLPDGSAVPETTVGDVVQVAQLLARELCQRQYDTSITPAVRQTWAQTDGEVRQAAASMPWSEGYPDNPGFWYGGALALAQQLSAASQRRNADVGLLDRVRAVVGERPDALEVWQDLRQFFLARRPKKMGRNNFAYPEITVADALALVSVFDDQLRDVPTGAWSLATETSAWKRARERVDQLTRAAASQGEPYPEAERLWLGDTKRLAIYVSAAHDAMDAFGDAIDDQAARRRRS